MGVKIKTLLRGKRLKRNPTETQKNSTQKHKNIRFIRTKAIQNRRYPCSQRKTNKWELKITDTDSSGVP